MDMESRYYSQSTFLMEGALGERLKHEYGLYPDGDVMLASHVYDDRGREALRALWNEYIEIARDHGRPFLATTPTRRANQERIERSKYSPAIIADNVALLKSIRDQARHEMYVGALVGCRGNAYDAKDVMDETEAQRFHGWEIGLFAKSGVDFFYAGIMPALPEAAGMAKALSEIQIPYIISLMIRGDGRLLDGTSLHDAIAYIDEFVSYPPLCYMTNCVHPDVVLRALSQPWNRTKPVRVRFRGIQANASALAPEELDGSKDVQSSSPGDLAEGICRLGERMDLTIVGGCCGTDGRHLRAIAEALWPR